MDLFTGLVALFFIFNFYYFLYVNNLKKYFYLFIFFSFFLSFFLHFILSHVADRVFVLWPGVRLEPLRWESRDQDIGPPEASQPHVISISKSSPTDLRLNTKTQLHPTAS